MPEKSFPDELPARPRSAFAPPQAPDQDIESVEDGEQEVEYGKDGRRLGGAATSRFVSEYWTEERREEQRQRMRDLMAQGRVGGQNGFHRRKTKPFQQIAAEHAQSRAEEYIQKLDDMIFGQSKDKRLQLEAIREFMKMETWAVQNAREDEREFRAMTNDQLDSRLLELLGEALGIDLTEIVEGEVVEEETLALLAAGEEV